MYVCNGKDGCGRMESDEDLCTPSVVCVNRQEVKSRIRLALGNIRTGLLRRKQALNKTDILKVGRLSSNLWKKGKRYNILCTNCKYFVKHQVEYNTAAMDGPQFWFDGDPRLFC